MYLCSREILNLDFVFAEKIRKSLKPKSKVKTGDELGDEFESTARL